MNIIRTISANEWGGDQESILRLYRALVRTRLDYGSINLTELLPIKVLTPLHHGLAHSRILLCRPEFINQSSTRLGIAGIIAR